MSIAFIEDVKALYRNDPAAHNIEFVLYPGLWAITWHRLIHRLYQLRIPFIPRMMSQINRFVTGLEIHPGAKIGKGIFIDHGAGLVIGETAELGANCVLFHNVTIGGTGKHDGKRHPTIGDNVFIGTGAILLGPILVGSNSKIGANSFVVMRDIPPNCTVAGTPARIIKRNGVLCNEELTKTVEQDHHFKK